MEGREEAVAAFHKKTGIDGRWEGKAFSEGEKRVA
jgi:hypothetical protein